MKKLKDSIQLVYAGEKITFFNTVNNQYVTTKLLLDKTKLEASFKILKTGFIHNKIQKNAKSVQFLLDTLPRSFFIEDPRPLTRIPKMQKNEIKIDSITGNGLITKKILKDIRTMKIIVFGIGSLGCHIVQNLITLGAKNLILIDSDFVTAGNLNRQILYSHNSIGLKKVLAAKKTILQYDPTINVVPLFVRITKSNHLAELSLKYEGGFMFLTADEPRGKISEICADAMKKTAIPWVRINRNGFGPFWTPSKACPNCYYLQAKEDAQNLNGPKDSSINQMRGVISLEIALRVSILIKDFLHFLKNRKQNANSYCYINFPLNQSSPLIKYETTKGHSDCPCQS